jgi:hypothetical protein
VRIINETWIVLIYRLILCIDIVQCKKRQATQGSVTNFMEFYTKICGKKYF